jgi:type I restriction enzyme M protein
MSTHQELAGFIWSVADLLRGDYKQSEYGKVILPLTTLRRLDCVMEPTREAVWQRDESTNLTNKDQLLRLSAKLPFYNTSRQMFTTIGADAANVGKNLRDYINGFSPNAREILDKYDFDTQITRLTGARLLYPVVQKFADVDLHLNRVDNHQMGYLFEELIRRFSEISNDTAGEHFTPREVIKVMVNLLIAPDADKLTEPGHVINILDPACGTGGMLSATEDRILSLNPHATVALFGQEINAESYAICRSDMMLKGQDPSNIYFGNSFSEDGHKQRTFDYMLANPPFGVEWKKVKDEVEDEAKLGHAGRFGAGLPRINDGSFLFLQHMLSKMRPVAKGGSRSCSTAHRSSPARPSRASPTSAAGSWRTTFSKASSPCPTNSSTTPASQPTSGSSPTARRPRCTGRSSCSTRATNGSRCARASATSGK